MNKKNFTTILSVALLSVAPALAQVDMTRYVAMGDSLTAGFMSGGLGQAGQDVSYPSMIAAAGQASDFQQPIVTDPGIPAVLELVSLQGPTLLPAQGAGAPINATLPRPYNNLGVPGANMVDLVTTVGDINNLLAGNQDNVMHDLILRFPNTQLEQAIGLDPTFITIFIGNNDGLGAATSGTAIDGLTLTPAAIFQEFYGTMLGALTQFTTADIVVATLPKVTAIPFVTTLDPFITLPDGTRVPLIGTNGPLTEDTLVTLGAAGLLAQGIGIPTALGGTGIPLPDDISFVGDQVFPGVILRPDEVQAILARQAEFNAIIRGTAQAFNIPVVDIEGAFDDVVAHGLHFAGIDLSTDFITGGLFSYDGVHANGIGYGYLANAFIDQINASFNAGLPKVSLYQLMGGNQVGAEFPSILSAPEQVYSKEAFDATFNVFGLPNQPGGLTPIELDDDIERIDGMSILSLD